MVTVVSPAVPIPGAEQLPAPTEREALAIDERRAKAAVLRERGEDPYPHDYPGRTLVADLQAAQDPRALGPGERPDLGYRIAGRAIARRGHGKTLFMDLRDVSGTIQVVARRDDLGDELMARMEELDVV